MRSLLYMASESLIISSESVQPERSPLAICHVAFEGLNHSSELVHFTLSSLFYEALESQVH